MKDTSSCIFLFFAKDYPKMASGWQRAPYFTRHRRELVSKPAVWLKKRWGGYRRMTLLHRSVRPSASFGRRLRAWKFWVIHRRTHAIAMYIGRTTATTLKGGSRPFLRGAAVEEIGAVLRLSVPCHAVRTVSVQALIGFEKKKELFLTRCTNYLSLTVKG